MFPAASPRCDLRHAPAFHLRPPGPRFLAAPRQRGGRAGAALLSCPNCGAGEAGRYCHGCGQDLRELPTVRHFVAGALDDLFSVDGRVWRTVGRLVANPGSLSADYFAGRRARYVPPLRLYLVVSVIYFGAFTLLESRFFMGMQLAPVSEHLPRLMVLFLPAAALLLHLFFGRARRLYVEHLVVALHYHAFAFLVFTVQALLDAYLATSPRGPLETLAILAYALLMLWVLAALFRTLRAAYGEPWLAVVPKGVVLLAIYLVVILLVSAATAGVLGRL